MKENLTTISIVALGFLLGGLMQVLVLGGVKGNVGTSLIPTTYVIASSSASSVTTASTVVAATSTSRQYLRITSPATVFCNGDRGAAAVANVGFRLGSSTDTVVFSADTNNLYTGAVNCISGNGATVVLSVYQR